MKLVDDMKQFEAYWRAVRKRKLTKAEREAYMIGRIHQLRERVRDRVAALSRARGEQNEGGQNAR